MKITCQKKKASVTMYMVALFIVFLAFSAFVVDGSITFNLRQKLQNITESAALAAAEEFNSSQDTNTIKDNVYNTAQETFNLLSKDGLNGIAKLDIKIDIDAKTVSLKSNAKAPTYFLAFLGVSTIKLNALATAKSESLSINANYSGINWLTTRSAYLSDIISRGSNYRDTAILFPLGDFGSASFQYTITNYSLIDSSDGQPLSLGPGGYITIKLPVPIVDKKGADLSIEEIGAKEGYLVYAGIDNDPDNPYTQNPDDDKDTSAGITWVNISNCGKSKEINDNVVYSSSVGDKFYGSGDFDIAKAGLSVVKYIRIIDDNEETAFVKDGNTYYKTTLYGESSSATSGVDIDSVTVLNHVKLIKPVNF